MNALQNMKKHTQYIINIVAMNFKVYWPIYL